LPPLDPLQQAQSSTEPDEEPVDVPPTPREDYSADETNVARGTTVTSPSTSSTISSGSSTLPVTFDSPVGPAIDMPSTSTALDVFNLTFGNNIMEMLVEQTNLYATQNPPSAWYKWYNTTLSEMYLFVGIIIAMGVHQLPFIRDYWSSDCLLGVPGISSGMPIDRFKVLLRCFHLNDNTKAVPRQHPGYDQLQRSDP
jgi:hypothetical protein